MTTSTRIRNLLHLVTCASFLLLVAMVTRAFSQNNEICPTQNFGPRCQLTCQCEDDALCDDVTGHCPKACREGWSGPNCQTHNVVLGMPTKMKTSDWSKGARAVDGDVGTCVTSLTNRTGWWRVDMEVSRTVFFMEIIFANKIVPSGRVKVHVSDYADTFWGKPCTRLPSSHERSKFACDVPSKGRYFGIINQFGQISLCEVRVFVCTPFTYGVDCSHLCNCEDPNEVCNPVNGVCVSGCKEGWTGSSCHRKCKGRYGMKCRYGCGHCLDGVDCHHVTGMCPAGCHPGWSGPKCTDRCPAGLYGKDCQNHCHQCLDNEPCEPISGNCPWRCQPGWQGDMCDQACGQGTYGQSCNFTCGHCYQTSVCDRESGVCPIGCQPGYEGLFCTQSCISGNWGPNCRWQCGQCVNSSCDQQTGHCDDQGCTAGWAGLKCDTKCLDGTYGPMCLLRCGHCQNGCNPLNGTCSGMCRPGWRGSKCTEPCSNNTFGRSCQSRCGHCNPEHVCNHVTGHCPGDCLEDFQLPECLARRKTSSSHAFRPNLYTLLICCISIGVCILCAIGASLLIMRWRRSRNTPSCKYAPPAMQQTTV